MADNASTATIVDYYTFRYREDQRLRSRPCNRLEWRRTCELLDELLPAAPARILDVGGADGAYARRLVTAGHRVRLLDLVPAHVAQARAGRPAIDAAVADARALPEPDDAYDVTLLLGPLYHLPEPADRRTALAEAVRVTRPGGLVVAAAISRFAGPLHFAATRRWSDTMAAEARALAADGRNDPGIGFTVAYFHRVEELTGELQAAGLTRVTVQGIEGPGWTAAEASADAPDADVVFDHALALARIYGHEPALLAASAHLLAAGTVTAGTVVDLAAAGAGVDPAG
ncbi:class I SAM-dependent methyltransferase [Solwaraspora sp. WMMA2056]|uniref:class I SAM-dependent methyltransferase n=1 Tax=Solwaraspora sp. WMMA2056 TaxID=3015161 RepID=UPI00259BD27E|nr:class I SAM-dependent methyltransferase [Solwaraspora sp. WMMA2056]WJK42818.1 class I SAM-dependent methyltransferase [Solwaraspora sp. WMMA2056]